MIKVEESAHLLNRTTARPLASGVSTVEEGACLVADYDSNGVMQVRPSSGMAGEIFVGFALTEKTELETVVAQDTFSSKAGKSTYTLSHSYKGSGRITGVDAEDNAEGMESDVDANDEWHVDGTTLTLQTDATVGTSFTIEYRYTPTVVDYRRIQGDVHPGPAVGVSQGVITVLEAGELLFDNYDTTKDWKFIDTAAVNLKTGANGRITRGTANEVNIRGLVTQQPRAYESAGDAVLMGLSFTAG